MRVHTILHLKSDTSACIAHKKLCKANLGLIGKSVLHLHDVTQHANTKIEANSIRLDIQDRICRECEESGLNMSVQCRAARGYSRQTLGMVVFEDEMLGRSSRGISVYEPADDDSADIFEFEPRFLNKYQPSCKNTQNLGQVNTKYSEYNANFREQNVVWSKHAILHLEDFLYQPSSCLCTIKMRELIV